MESSRRRALPQPLRLMLERLTSEKLKALAKCQYERGIVNDDVNPIDKGNDSDDNVGCTEYEKEYEKVLVECVSRQHVIHVCCYVSCM